MRVSGRYIIVFLLALTCLLVSTAGVGSKRSHTTQSPAEWTVMIFMNGDNNLEPFALMDFAEMSSVNYNPLVNVVVQMDRIPGYSYAYGDWTNTLRFKLSPGMTPTEAEALPPAQSELPHGKEVNMGDPNALASFVDWARRKYPAQRYMLVMWDHGDGWLRFHTRHARRNSRAAKAERIADFKAANALRVARGVAPKRRRFSLDRTLDVTHRSISLDVSNNDRLYMREVQNGLEGALGASRLQIVGFDACLMQMVENGFALRHVTEIMVGSEELVPGEGWQYSDWLGVLMAQPTMDAVALSRALVRSYDSTWRNVDPETTLSAVDISNDRMDALAEAVSNLGVALTDNLLVDLANIKEARRNCIPYAPGRNFHGIDLYHFCERLAALTTVPLLRTRAQAVMQLLDSMVIDRYAGPDREGDFGSRGLAIYFPETKSLYESDPYAYAYRDNNHKFPVEFVQRHRWDNFLHAYFERVP